MAISDTSKIDLLYKKLFGVTKTDTATNKSPSNEAIASPALIRGDRIWTQSGSIPATAADVTNIVQGYLTTSRIECTADTTAAPVSSVYPSWKTNLTDWITPEFGSTYLVKVYVDTAGAANPASTGTQLSDAGSGGTGEWYFDYQSGVLNFIGGTIPAALTVSKVIFITGYRYIGSTGVLSSGATANAAVFATTANTANTVLSISNFTTANLTEGVNLYYTNSRVRSAISAGTGVAYNSSTGSISIGQNVSTVADVTFNSITVTGNLFITGNASYVNSNSLVINDPLLQIGYGNPADNYDLGFIGHYYSGGLERHAGLFRDHSDGKFRFFDNLTSEPGLNDIDTANVTFRYASVVASTFEGNVLGTISSLTNHTTSNLAEGTNQYFTPDRAIQAVNPRLTTANVTELNNQYFTNARVLANVSAMSINVFADVDITNIANDGVLRWNGSQFIAGTVGAASSSSFANTAGFSNVSLLADKANLVNSLSNFTTANLSENTNLYFTNARVLANIELMSINVFADVDLTGISTDGILQWNGTKFVAATVAAAGAANVAGYAQIAGTANVALFAERANVANTVLTISNFTTANLAENTNLYYTNSRVTSAVTPLLTAANIVNFDSRVVSTVTPVLTTGNVVETTNQYFTNVRVLQAVTPLLTAANIVNFDSRVVTTVTPLLSTANVIEDASNLYYTNSRAITAVNPRLTTANVIEITNQYFTNARVMANVEQMSVNVFIDVDISGIQVDGYLLWNGTKFIPGSLANKLTTANVVELTNLYFTNARAVVAIQGADATMGNVTTTGLLKVSSGVGYENVSGIEFASNPAGGTGDVARIQYFSTQSGDDTILEISVANNPGDSINIRTSPYGGGVGINVQRPTADFDVDGNTIIRRSLTVGGVTTGTTGRYTGFLYANGLVVNGSEFVNGESGTSAITATRITANIWNGIYTANVIESPTNLYFTNARVAPALLGQDVDLKNLTVQGNLIVQGDTTTLNVSQLSVEDKIITIASGATNSATADSSGIEIAGAGARLIYYVLGDKFLFNKNLDVNGTLSANSWNNLYTSNVVEDINLYYTNARVVSAVTPLLTAANIVNFDSRVVSTTTPLLTAANIVNFDSRVVSTTTPLLTTGNVVETTNQYFTNVRVLQAVTPLLTTANVAELTNLYFTNARVLVGITTGTVQGNITASGIITAKDLVATGNLYANGIIIRNIDVTGTILAGNIESAGVNANIISAVAITTNTLVAESVTSNKWERLYTSNVIENTNLYFTNVRAVLAVSPLLTTANVTELTNQYFTNARAVIAVTPLLTTANVVETTNQYFTNVRVLQAVNPLLTTANVVETTNQYFTNVRVLQAVNPLLTTANVIETTNQYFTNAKVLVGITTGLVQGNISVSNKITANSIFLGSGTGGSITGLANLETISLVARNITANIWNGIYTANVIESPTNLYFTNARVLANVSAMSINVFADVDMTGLNTDGILIWNGNAFVAGSIQAAAAANVAQYAFNANIANLVLSIGNFTTANLVEGTNLYFNNTRARAALDGQNLSLNNLTANTLTLNNSLTSSVKVTNITSPGVVLITKFDIARYRTAEFIYTVIGKGEYANLYNSGKILLLHDNTDVYFNQYGILLTGNGTELLTFSANINSSNVNLYGQVTNANIICDVRLSGTTYTEA